MRSHWRASTILCALLVAIVPAAGIAAGRPTPPAALDGSFGLHGIAILGKGFQVYGEALQPDGKLVVVGDQQIGHVVRLLVGRLTVAGRLDPGFNRGHMVLGPTERTGGSIARAVAIQRDGKIVVAGVLTDRTGLAQDGMLVDRFTTSGALDRRFGSAGTATPLAGTVQSAAYALALQSDGKIVLAGNGPGSDGFQHVALARLTSSGLADRSFGASGVRIADGSQDLGRQGTAAGVGLQPGGKIVVAGSVAPTLQVSDAVVARFSAVGNLDRSFGSSGRLLVPGAVESGGAALFRALTVSRGGAIVAAGSAASDRATPAYALVVSLSSNGKLQSSFGRGGIVALPAEHGSTAPSVLPGANGVAVARGGVVVIAGGFLESGLSEAALWSLTPRGSTLASGTIRTTLGHSLGSGTATGLAIDSKGRIVVAGEANNFVAFNSFGLRYHGFGP